ncbi:MAG TPA: aldo/keto reductase [Armatimonadota bacterium]|jgi:aryl-alcohol dehydrogenase-like predicted oxidoreductase
MDRRDFFKTGSLAALGGTFLGNLGGHETAPGLEARMLGHTGHYRSVVTLGGIVVMNEDQDAVDRLVDDAIDAGVNGVDVAPSYGDAELKLGHALRGKRDLVFLGCKTGLRDKAGAAAELRRSLERLETDRFDLYQFHGLDKPEELEQVLGPDGALEAVLEAKAEGLVRFIGLTGHRPDTLMTALQRFEFDTVMFPYNFILNHHGYGEDLLQDAWARGVGILAIKPIAARRWEEGEARPQPKCWYKPFATNHEISLAVRWVLGQRVSTIIPSGDMTLFRRALKAAQHNSPLLDAERLELERKAAEFAPLFDAHPPA